MNYPVVKKLKRALLWCAFGHFAGDALRRNTSRAKKFRAFVKAEAAWLDGYALFRTLMEENDGDERWDRWPEEQRTFTTASKWLKQQSVFRRKELEHKIKFYMYVQWLAFTQWRELNAYCTKKGVALMGDLPFGVSYYSSDVFLHREIFDLTWSGGAPPEKIFKSDPFTEKWGQNWGIPYYRWDVMRANGFAWWRQRVQKVREIFHLFRIDHILGFYRIYSFPWRPQENASYLDLTPEQARERCGGRLPGFQPRDDSNHQNAEANRHEGEEYLRALLREVGEQRLIGEDLGVVPDYVRPSLTSLGIAGFKIPTWENGHDGLLAEGKSYQRLSLTTYATHDHPPLKTLWDDLHKAAAAGDNHAQWELKRLAIFAGVHTQHPPAFNEEIHNALLAALLHSNSWMAVFMITDLFGSAQRFNVPGAVADSNWSERLPEPVSKWSANPDISTKTAFVKRLLRETGRLHV